MADRLLCPNERMTDVFDRASTLNFTTVAHVRGSITEEALKDALGRLGQRHPLLRAGIHRAGKLSRFVANAAAPIGLTIHNDARDEWRRLAEQSIAHREWRDEGPRAELTYLREGPDSFTLLLCLHHVVSDGSSGMLAMRDLLAFLGGVPLSTEPVPSPGPNSYFPKTHGGPWSYLRALLMVVRSSRAARPRRLHKASSAPFESRAPAITRFQVAAPDAQRITERARRAGATVHGVLCAATAQAIQERLSEPSSIQRMLHPVCLRRYLRELEPSRAAPREAVGCYVSSVETDHHVTTDGELSALAREISSAVRRKKAEGIPLLTAPIAGPFLTDRFADRPPAKLRELAEHKLMLNTFSITNLGKLEQHLELTEQIGTLTLEDIFFVAAGSILGALGASATSFRDKLSFQLVGTTPLVAAATVTSVADRIEELLLDFARAPDAAF